MSEKLKPLDMGFNEALFRLSKAPRQPLPKARVDKNTNLTDNKKIGVSESPPRVVKKT